MRWGFPDDRVLPKSASAHQVGDQLRHDFVNNSDTAVTVVVPDANGVSAADIDRYAADLSRVADVSAVSAPTEHSSTATGSARRRRRPASAGSAFLTVDSSAAAVLRPLGSPARPPARGGGPRRQARRHDGNRTDEPRQRRRHHARLPLVLGLIAVIMFVLLFLLTGSVVMPLKALVLNIFR